MSKKKKNDNGFMPMFQGGTFPMPPVPPIPPVPFAPWGASNNKDSAGEDSEDNAQKENIKSTVKSAWTQKADRNKSKVDNRREQWKQFFDYRMEMQDTFAALIPDDTSSLPPFVQMLPIAPKAFMERLKEFQIMANEHFVEQADSVMDFFFKGQEQFYDLVSEAMEKKEEDESAQADDGKDSAVENAKAEEVKAAKKTGAKTRKKTGTRTGKKAKAEETAEDNAMKKAVETVKDNAVKEAEAETVKPAGMMDS